MNSITSMEAMDCQPPEKDGVNLQCVSSSDFVVGKQTVFNGPVTIINHVNGGEDVIPRISKEEIVIRENILTPKSVEEIKAFSESKATAAEKDGVAKGSSGHLRGKIFGIPVFVWLGVAVAAFVILLVFLLAYLREAGEDEAAGKEFPNSKRIQYNGREYTIYGRDDWRAKPPLSEVEMKIPVPYVVISHTAGRFCYSREMCVSILGDIQSLHMSKVPPLLDIAYSFMVGGDGNIYTGRGWKNRNAIGGFASAKNVDINFIGAFHNFEEPTFPQTEAVKALIEFGVNSSYIDPNYSLIAANASYATLSPGQQVYKKIKTWPHFDPEPKLHLKS